MKAVMFVVSLFFLIQVVVSQEKTTAKDFGYTDQVKRVEEVEYRYKESLNKYEISREHTLEFNKGRLLTETSKSNAVLYVELTRTYTYNEKRNLVTVTEKSSSGNTTTYQYTYNNGKLVSKKSADAKNPTEVTYEYNSKAQLVKVTTRKGDVITDMDEYTDYKNAGTFTLREYTYFNGQLSYTETTSYVNDVKQKYTFLMQSTGKPTEHSYTYDRRGKLVEERIGNTIVQNEYRYDDRGNAFQVKLGGTPNTFRFCKIQYTDGLALGTTEFSEYFVKQYDKNSKSYAYNKMNTTKATDINAFLSMLDEEITYEVLKVSDTKFRVRTADGEELTHTVNAAKSPNGSDFLVYDPLMGQTAICKDFYQAATTKEKWISMTLLPDSGDGCYWFLNSATKGFSIIKEGRYIDMTTEKFKIVVQPGNTGNYLVQQNGVDKFMMKGVAGKKMDEFHPLETVKTK